MKAVGYLRVSTDMQDPESQKQAIEIYAKERGYLVEKYFVDDITGSMDPLERAGFKGALSYCVANDVKIILMYDLTRFYRADAPSLTLQRLREVMDKYGVLIEFAREPAIEDPLLRELWLFIKSWFSTYERIQISLRTKYGMLKLKSKGKLYHRPSIVHYYAATLFMKNLSELTQKEVEIASRKLRDIVLKYWNGPYKKTRIFEVLRANELRELYDRFPNAPRDYLTFYRLVVGKER